MVVYEKYSSLPYLHVLSPEGPKSSTPTHPILARRWRGAMRRLATERRSASIPPPPSLLSAELSTRIERLCPEPLQQGLVAFLAAQGASTTARVANIWDSAAEASQTLAQDLVAPMEALWLECDREAESSATAGARGWAATCSEPSIGPLRPPIVGGAGYPPADPCSGCAGHIPASRLPSRPRRPMAGKTPLAATCKISPPLKGVRKPDAAMRAIAYFWSSAKLAGGASAWDKDFGTGDQEILKRQFDAMIKASGGESLPARAASLRRWRRWALGRTPWCRPAAAQVAAFLQSLAESRPTAAVCVSRNLRWCAKVLRLELELDHPLVTPWTKNRSSAPTRQATPHAIKELAHLEHLSQSANRVLAYFASAAVVMILGTVRFAHAQRSSLSESTPSLLVFWCMKGKRRIGAARPGFQWVVPRRGITGVDYTKAWMEGNPSGATNFAVRTYTPAKGDVTMATSLSDRPISYARYSATVRAILQLPPLGASQQEAAGYSTYSARRFLPTVAGCLALPSDYRAAIGNWQEAAKGDPSAVRETLGSMASRYDHSKAHAAATAKHACCVALRRIVAQADSYDITWAGLRAAAPEWQALVREASAVCDELHPACGSGGPQESPFPLRPSEHRSPPPHREPQEREAVVSDHAVAQAASWPWVVPHGKTGKIHTMVEQERETIRTACGRSIRASSPSGLGVHVALTVGSEWCGACFQRLPEGVADQCGGRV